MAKAKRPFVVYVLLLLLLVQALSALAGGIPMVADPSGAMLGFPADMLDDSPFDSYLVPGLILTFVLGVFPLAVMFGLWRRSYWARFGSLVVGVALVIWIGVQILTIGYQADTPLQIIYGSLGFVLLVLALLPAVRRYCGGRP
ncbi:MAG: hypothetical protein PVH29_01065 [Candidatus Zixiibacteriota bacterium]|jgi:hypothetical protein